LRQPKWGAPYNDKAETSVRRAASDREPDRIVQAYPTTTATALLADLVDGQSKGILASRMFFYGKPKLLVVDELGYMPLERQSAHLFFQLVSHRYEKASMLITTNQSVTQWGQVFGDDVIAAAILDRLLHHSHTFMVQGESYRLPDDRIPADEPIDSQGATEVEATLPATSYWLDLNLVSATVPSNGGRKQGPAGFAWVAQVSDRPRR